MNDPCISEVVGHINFPGAAGIEGGFPAGLKCCLISRKKPYFHIVNPFDPKIISKDGQMTPNSVTRPWWILTIGIVHL